MKLILTTYAFWVLIGQVSAWLFYYSKLDTLPIKELATVNFPHTLFALFLFFYVYHISQERSVFINNAFVGFVLAFTLTIILNAVF